MTTRPRRAFGKIRRLPSKKYQASYVGPDRERHVAPETFTAKMDAEGWLSNRRKEIEAGTWTAVPPAPPAAVPTLAEYFTGGLAGRDVKPRTREHYRSIFDRCVSDGLGDIRLDQVSPAAVRAWHTGLGADQPTQRAHAYGLVKSVFKTAVNDELVAANPCRVENATTTKRVHQPKPATLAELTAIVGAMPAKYRPMVLLAAWCAMRFGELTELRRDDVDLDAGVIHVRRGVVRVGGGFVVGDPKSAAGARTVAVPPHLVPMLTAHLRSNVNGRNGLLFPAADGLSHMAPSTLYKVWYPARKAGGRADLRFHDLRHTGAVLAAQTGATLAELMARLGHSTAGAAMRYQHAAAVRDAVIAAALSKLAADNAG